MTKSKIRRRARSEEGIKSGGEKLGEISEKFSWHVAGGETERRNFPRNLPGRKRNYLQEICLCFKRNPDLPQLADSGTLVHAAKV